MRVLIIGAGLGGLCLAQALRKSGVDVAVFERDDSPVARLQGYRLHIDDNGRAALESALPAQHYELFLATAGIPLPRTVVYDDQLAEVWSHDHPAPTTSRSTA
jgi:2-polyprenyl-6-methoxyphenol hydroxylase-like FAD-dependent oxidoreductase